MQKPAAIYLYCYITVNDFTARSVNLFAHGVGRGRRVVQADGSEPLLVVERDVPPESSHFARDVTVEGFADAGLAPHVAVAAAQSAVASCAAVVSPDDTN